MLMKAETKTRRMAATPVIVLFLRDWMILRESCCKAAGKGCIEVQKGEIQKRSSALARTTDLTHEQKNSGQVPLLQQLNLKPTADSEPGNVSGKDFT